MVFGLLCGAKMHSRHPFKAFGLKVAISVKRTLFYVALPLFVITLVPIFVVSVQRYIGFPLFFLSCAVLLLGVGIVLILRFLVASGLLDVLAHIVENLLNLTNRL